MHVPVLERRLRALFALGLVALLVVGNMAGALHVAVVRHTLCDVHGDLVHSGEHAVGPAGAEVHDEHRLAEHADALPSLRALDRGSDPHDHCSTASWKRERAFAWRAPPTVVPAPEEGRGPCVRRAAPLRRAGERILFAPKQSPPA